jgi:hypothetical protein
MTTVLQTVFEVLERLDERLFLDWIRENKKDLLKQEQQQINSTQLTLTQVSPTQIKAPIIKAIIKDDPGADI